MIRPLYDWTMRISEHPRSLWALAIVAFVESSFFPIPPHAMLVPMILARQDRAWLIAAVCTLSSVLGGAFGYLIGLLLGEAHWVAALVNAIGLTDAVHAFSQVVKERGFEIILIKGFIPIIPYKVVTIACGFAKFNFGLFMLGSLLVRGSLFFLMAALLKTYGAPIRDFIEKRLKVVMTVFGIALIGGFLVLKYVL